MTVPMMGRTVPEEMKEFDIEMRGDWALVVFEPLEMSNSDGASDVRKSSGVGVYEGSRVREENGQENDKEGLP